MSTRNFGEVDDGFEIVGAKLPKPHEDDAAYGRARCVRRTRRVADVAASGIAAVVVLKNPIEHEKLLAAWMPVRGERRVGGVANDRCRHGLLAAQPEQHAPLDAGGGALHPRQTAAVDERGTRKVGVNLHHRSSENPPSTKSSAPTT